jgi:hypothetical protein
MTRRRDRLRRSLALALAFAAVICGGPASADAPPLPGQTFEVRSPNGACVARVQLDRRRIVVSNLSGSEEWYVPGWHRSVVVANDCRAIGIGFDGLNLIGGSQRRPETVIMRFVHRDGRERLVRFGQIYRDGSILPETASHHVLHQGTEWDGRIWSIRTVDGRRLSFAP